MCILSHLISNIVEILYEAWEIGKINTSEVKDSVFRAFLIRNVSSSHTETPIGLRVHYIMSYYQIMTNYQIKLLDKILTIRIGQELRTSLNENL
jgi:hypothetical protein